MDGATIGNLSDDINFRPACFGRLLLARLQQENKDLTRNWPYSVCERCLPKIVTRSRFVRQESGATLKEMEK